MFSDYRRAVCLSLLALSACAGNAGEEVAALRYPRPSSLGTIPSPAAEPSTRVEVQTVIYNWFLRAGYPPHQAAALVDHARVESGFNPCISGPGGVRYTYQWNGTRLQRLYEFAGTRTCPPLTKQLEFADNELRSNPNFSCFQSASTREAAAVALLRGFGRGRC
jgi:Phage tail lysozyme